MTDTRSRGPAGSAVGDPGPDVASEPAGDPRAEPATAGRSAARKSDRWWAPWWRRSSSPVHTGSPLTSFLVWASLPAMTLWALYGLVWSGRDDEMGDMVRLFYVHVPIAVLLSGGVIVTTLGSAMWLWRRTPGWDALALAGAELGALFGVLTLITGAIWGRPTWGTYWSWDPRLTTTALLVALTIGYLALRRVAPDGGVGGSVPAALVGLLLLPNLIVVRYSVNWWRSLHQEATVLKLDPSIESDQLVALMFGLLTGGLVFAWLLIHRFRVAHLEQQAQRQDLAAAVAARRAEAGLDESRRPDQDDREVTRS